LPALAVGFTMASVESVARLAAGLGAAQTFVGLCLPYVPYFVAGHLLRERMQGAAKSRNLLLAAAACSAAIACATAALVGVLGSLSWMLLNGYLSPFVIAMSLFVYVTATRTSAADHPPAGRASRFVRGLAPLTLGIYVLHPFSLLLLARCGIRPHAPHPLIGVPLVTVLAFLLAAGMARAIACVPVLRRTVT
jgi:surface polysaccharide O-acyltransferase-like enzyme